MTGPVDHDRRRLLRLITHVPAIPALGRLGALGGGAVLTVACSDDEPAETAEVSSGLVAFGARYLEVVPEENDEATLRRLLDLEAEDGVTEEDVMMRLDEAIAADFANDDIVAIDGWLLSRTEARAAALVALTS